MWEQGLKTQIGFLDLLTVNWGPVMKGSGNGVTVSAGNVFIFKKEKRQECYFQIRKQSFGIFGSVPLQSNRRIQGTHTQGLACARKHTKAPQEYCQRLYLCPMLCCRPGLGRDDRPKSCVWGALRAYLTLKPFTGVCLGLPVMLGPMFGLPDP